MQYRFALNRGKQSKAVGIYFNFTNAGPGRTCIIIQFGPYFPWNSLAFFRRWESANCKVMHDCVSPVYIWDPNLTIALAADVLTPINAEEMLTKPISLTPLFCLVFFFKSIDVVIIIHICFRMYMFICRRNLIFEVLWDFSRSRRSFWMTSLKNRHKVIKITITKME